MAPYIETRGLYQPGYPAVVKQRPTILASWWCTGFALVIIAVRCFGRLIRTNRLFQEDKIMAISIVPLLARMALIHVVLLYGTNNMGQEGNTDVGSTNVDHLKTGSKLVLAARVLYAMFLWIQKFTILQSLRRLTGQFWKKGYEYGLNAIRWCLVATFLAVFVATIGECHPISHYWQVQPDPGPQCREAYGQLITMGTLNIITDLVLIVYPVSIIIASQFTTKRKIQLTLLFALSFVPIAFTGYRIPKIIEYRGRQQFRSLWASLEILAANGVANAIVIGSFIRDRGPKKTKYKFGSTTTSLDRPPPQRRRRLSHWGSDESLFGGTGVGLAPELRKMPDLEARPAPVAVAADEHGHIIKPAAVSQASDNDATSSEASLKSEAVPHAPVHSPGQDSMSSTIKTGFFDVGGLLDNGPLHHTATTSTYPPTISESSPKDHLAAGRRGSEALLHDMGGLLSPVSEGARRPSLTPKPAPAALPPPTVSHRAPSEISRVPPGRGRIDSEDTLIEEPPQTISGETRPPEPRSSRPANPRSGTLQSLQDVGGLLP